MDPAQDHTKLTSPHDTRLDPTGEATRNRTQGTHRNRTVLLVLNYRNWTDCVNFLQSVLEHELTNADIVILDNASGNDSVPEIRDWIDARFPADAPPLLDPSRFTLGTTRFAAHVEPVYVKGRVALFSSDQNYGFSGGNNALAHIGRALGHEFLYLLNSDTLFTDRFAVSKLEALHDADPLAYASGPCVINFDGSFDSPFRRDSFWGDALYYGPVNRIRRLFSLPILQFDISALSRPSGAQVYKISGAAMFFPTARFFELDGLDENVWLSSEEAILGEKVLKAGGKIIYLPTTVLLHVKAASPRPKAKRIDILANHFTQRNYYYRRYRGYLGWQMALLRAGQRVRLLMARL
jgi:GT2 family glycosyltransferase